MDNTPSDERSRQLKFVNDKTKPSDYTRGKNHLLVIGIDEYEACNKLSNAVNDARDIAELLIEKYQFDGTSTYFNSLYNAEATWQAIDDELTRCATKVKAPDSLVIFFAGHGHYEKDTKAAYLVPVKAFYNRINDYYSYDRLMRKINAIKSQHTFLIVDSCYSGAFLVEPGRVAENTKREKDPSRWILASGRHEIVPDSSKKEKVANSPFTDKLKETLDRYASEGISVMGLIDLVTDAVANNETQTPIGRQLLNVGDRGGQFIFHPKRDRERDWNETRKESTVKSFQTFINIYKKGQYVEEAYWGIAILKGSRLGFRDYGKRYPKGKYFQESIKKLKEIDQKKSFDRAMSQGEGALLEFIDIHKKGYYVELAREEIKRIRQIEDEGKIWLEALEIGTIEGYEKYLRSFEEGFHSEEARKEIERLKTEDNFWSLTVSTDTTDAYQKYTQKFPNGKYSFEAKTQFEIKYWEEVRKEGTFHPYEKYLEKYPNGKYRQTAQNTLKEHKAWEETSGVNTMKAYEKYLSDFPNSLLHKSEAEEHIFWLDAREKNDVEAYQNYLDKYKQGKFVSEAIRIIEEFTKPLDSIDEIEYDENHEQYIDEQIEIIIKSYQNYLDDYPKGKYSQEARIKIEAILKEQKEWRSINSTGLIEGYRKYLKEFPDQLYKKVSEDHIAWIVASVTDTIESYEKYLIGFPKGLYVKEAEEEIAWRKAQRLDTLGEYIQYLEGFNNPKYELEAKEQIAWLKAKETNRLSAYKEYKKNFPGGKHTEQVRNTIIKIQLIYKVLPVFLVMITGYFMLPPVLLKILPTKTLPPTLAPIPAGTFRMGDIFQKGDTSESPVQLISLPKFRIAPYELTIAEFEQFVEETNYQTDADEKGGSYVWTGQRWELKAGVNWRHDPFGELRSKSDYNHPVIHVSWNDAIDYCNWLSQKHGLEMVYEFSNGGTEVHANFDSSGYRLPAEGEWEFAARQGGTEKLFGNGKDQANTNDLNYNGQDSDDVDYAISGEFRRNTVAVTDLEGSKNSLGLAHMSGNVSEWCWNPYVSYQDMGEESDKVDSFHGPRVLRGGAWINQPYYLRVSSRGSYPPDQRYGYVGFRLAQTVKPGSGN